MAYFAYTGRDAQGALVTGTLEGADPGSAAGLLLAQGVTPLKIEETAQASAEPGQSALEALLGPGITAIEVMLFSRQLYTLLKSGVPILRALAGLEESTPNKAMIAMLRDLRQGLESGRELSVAMRKHDKVFSKFYVSMIQVGEMTGRMEDVLLQLYHHLEFEKFMREQVKTALRYPSFVIAAMAIAIGVINVMVIPAFAKVFASFKGDLPLMTRILIGFSDFTVHWWPAIVGGFVAAVFLFKRWTATKSGELAWDRMKLKIPVAGTIVLKATLARFAKSLAMAGKSGVPIVQALATVSTTVDNAYISECVTKMQAGVERGESVLRTATATGVFTPVVLQMIAVGEESGALDDLMDEIGGLYQQEVEYELKTLGAQIEPILIVFLGVLVMILALGVFLPIWDLGRISTQGAK
jgi:MSHA biogenesis protein MshG